MQMNKQLVNLLKASPVKPHKQKTWKRISDSAIHAKLVEKLSYVGLLQAVDNLAYNIYLNSRFCVESGLSDKEFDDVFADKINKMEDIIRVVALGSGIHPTTIDLMVGFRTDYYTDSFISMKNE